MQAMCAVLVRGRGLQEFQGFRTGSRFMSNKAEVNLCSYWKLNLQLAQISVPSLNLGWQCLQ